MYGQWHFIPFPQVPVSGAYSSTHTGFILSPDLDTALGNFLSKISLNQDSELPEHLEKCVSYKGILLATQERSLVYVEEEQEITKHYPSTWRAVEISLLFFLNSGINQKWHKPAVPRWELLYFRKTFAEVLLRIYTRQISVCPRDLGSHILTGSSMCGKSLWWNCCW